MFEIRDKLDDVADNLEEIVKNYYKLSVVNAADKSSKIGSLFMVNVFIVALAFFVLLFAGLGAGFWIGQALQNPMLGFFIVAGFFLLILLIILLLKGKVIVPLLRDIIIKNIYD
ncbi:MAG: phage holin family protein [Niabella sp.]